jgi:opacity protein-like surface antigen
MPKRKFLAFFVIAFLMIAAEALQAGSFFKIKLFGGLDYVPTGGDFKSLFESTSARWKYVGYTGTFDLDYKPLAWEGGIEAMFAIAPHFELGFGAGYLDKTWNQRPQINYTAGTVNGDIKTSITGFPLTLEILYGIPLGPARFNIFGGGDGFLGTVKDSETQDYAETARAGQPNWKWKMTSTFTSERKAAFGFHAGAGLEIAVSGGLSLCLDALYRSLSWTDVKGKYDYSSIQTWTGGSDTSDYHSPAATVWYSTSTIWNQVWHYLDFSETVPTTSDSSRPFKFDVSGWVFRIGLKMGV